jgi:hypothetical protein
MRVRKSVGGRRRRPSGHRLARISFRRSEAVFSFILTSAAISSPRNVADITISTTWKIPKAIGASEKYESCMLRTEGGSDARKPVRAAQPHSPNLLRCAFANIASCSLDSHFPSTREGIFSTCGPHPELPDVATNWIVELDAGAVAVVIGADADVSDTVHNLCSGSRHCHLFGDRLYRRYDGFR